MTTTTITVKTVGTDPRKFIGEGYNYTTKDGELHVLLDRAWVASFAPGQWLEVSRVDTETEDDE